MFNGLRATLEAVGILDSLDDVDHAFRARWAAHETEYGGRLCGCEEALKAFQAAVTFSVAALTMLEDEGMATSIEPSLQPIVDRPRMSAGPDEQLDMDVFIDLGIEGIGPWDVTSSVDAIEILRKRILPGSSITADIGDDVTMVDVVCRNRGASINAPTEPRARMAAMILARVNHLDPLGKSV